ncbi:MAG: glycosyltransferase, partial [Nitrospinae bacterium]|nr:glycosyltransferase [Nitrospinota bacterium]
DDPEPARALGRQARETVRDKFPKARFLNLWRRTVQEAIVEFLDRTGVSLSAEPQVFHEKKRKNILMDFVSYPATTAFYLERAFRKRHNVITSGAMITEEIKKQWNLENMRWPVTPQDIPRGNSTPLSEVIEQLPDKWTPDLYLWVETGLGTVPLDLAEHAMPKACYLIDTHLNLEKHEMIARQFDFVFLAQKAYVDAIKTSGCENVFWLPLACDPEIHGRKETDKTHEVGFAGTIGAETSRRNQLLDSIRKNFQLQCERRFMDEMAELYSASKIVFNNAVKNDLNMRVFEALCSGSLLMTDRAEGSGLELFFEGGKHLVFYEDGKLVETIRYYLDRPELMREIAEVGRAEVIKNHTYDHRAQSLIETLDRHFSEADGTALEPMPDYYKNVRHDVLHLVPGDAACILEVGCAAGFTGRELKKRQGVFVAGVELDLRAANEARKVLDDVVHGDIESVDLPYAEKSFDCILFADVLEHLVDPLAVLKKTAKLLKPGGTVVASLPNVQYFGLVHQLIEGNWTYQDEGILDRTHLRFFTFREMEKMFAEAGFEITEVDETLDPQYEKAKNSSGTLNVGRLTVRDLTPEELRRFFVFQYKIVARLKPAAVEAVDSPTSTRDSVLNTDLYDQARSLEDAGKYTEAVAVYQQLPGDHPVYADALARQGNCHMHLQDMAEAERCYRQCLEMEAANYLAGLGLGLLEIQTEKFEAATKRFLALVECNPDSDRAWCGLGIAYRKSERALEAMDALSRALELNCENAPALGLLLELAYEQNRFDEIEKAMTGYLEIHPANINILFGFAGILYKVRRLDKTRETLEMILALDPDHEDATMMLDLIDSERLEVR